MCEIWTMGEMLVEIMRPEPDRPFNEAGTFLGPYPSGAPAIFIDTVARLGHRAGIIGGVGLDGFGRNLLDRLENDGVNTDFVVICPGGSTAVAFVTYFQDGSRQFIFHIKGTPAEMVRPPRIDQVHMADYFHVMGCSLMISEEFRQTIIDTARLFREKGADITLDPNIRPELLKGRDIHEIVGPILEQCTILMPGEEELHLLSGKEINETGALDIQRQYGVQYVVLKRGRKGATVYGPDQVVESPSFPVDEVDPTGAGDCFDAGFLCSLAEGRSLSECLRVAAAAGALNASAFGPMEGNISRESIAEMLENT